MAFLFQKLAAGKTATAFADVEFMNRESGLKPNTKYSRDWFREKASNIQKINPRTVVDKLRGRSVTRVRADDIGRMFMYFYDPKTKEQLPYYDRFPLIFVVNVYQDGFLGINLHYLPPMYRAKLMDALYSTINNNRYDATTKLKLSYKLLESTSKLRWFKPCLKRYLYSHVRSNMVEVPVSEWDYCAMLPLERFKKATSLKVQKDSVSSIGSY